MSVDYGLKCTPASGSALTLATALGAVFVGVVVCSITSGTQVLDYANVPFGGLYALQVGEGVHTWAISNNGGASRLTFTYAKAAYQSSRNTTLYLYANATTEGSYGINAVNDLGQRVVSTIYPNARFLGKLTLTGQTPSKYDTTTTVSTQYSWYCNTATISYTPTSANHSTVVFWTIPSSTSTDYWYYGKPTLSGVAPNMYARLYYRGLAGFNGTLPVLPEAFAFEVGPYVNASTSYGIRVYDASGNVMFDGATPQLVVLSMITNVDYSTAGTSYTLPSGITPAIYFPQYINERKGSGCNIDGYAKLFEYFGMMQRNGTTLNADIITMNVEGDFYDCRDTVTNYYYGNKTGLVVPIIDATQYGGAAI